MKDAEDENMVRLQQAFDEMECDGWILTQDRMPEDDQLVVVWVNGCSMTLDYRTPHGEWAGRGSGKHDITHWRPLPKVPFVPSEPAVASTEPE